MPKTKPLKSYRIQNDVYSYVLYLLAWGTQDKANAWATKKLEPNQPFDLFNEYMQGRCYFVGDGKSHVLYLPYGDGTGIGTVAHEALHSVHHVLSRSGMQALSDETEEAYAYLMDWTMREIVRRIY